MRHFLFSLTMAAALVGCGQSCPPCVFEIPEGYKGWVWVEFDTTNSPPLQKRGGNLVFPIGSNGRLSTSSHAVRGAGHDEYYYVGQSRTRLPCTESWRDGGLIWGEGIQRVSGGGQESVYGHFFVGTFKEYQTANLPRE